jgi:hypothetical protein
VDEAALVELAQCRDNSSGQAQKVSHLHGDAEQQVERFAAWIFEHQHRPAAVAHELQRPHRPHLIQFILQSVFVGEAIKA